MVIMGVDLGKVRTGLSICDKFEMMAVPLFTVTEPDEDKLLDKIVEIGKEKSCEAYVVGLPKNMDGTKGESALNAERFADRLRDLAGKEVFMIDERGTTLTAANYLNYTDTRGKKRKSAIDTVSAVIILQNFLDSRAK